MRERGQGGGEKSWKPASLRNQLFLLMPIEFPLLFTHV